MNINLFQQRYILQQELGTKPGHKTYLAEDTDTNKQVVVKILYLGVDFDWQDLKLFEREAATLQTLNHPQIPKYIDSFELDSEDEKGFVLVQEYIPGESLETQLRSGRVFSETEVIQLTRSLLSILIYLHSFDPPIIHRDIKPSNIVVTNRSAHYVGDVFLVDFGSVQNLAATEGGTITVVGTYGYMPPEQFGGRTTPASDLYSLGATLIFLVTGLHPSELPEQELQIQFRNHCQISPSFADWLEWMSEPSQSKRFSTAQIALEKLDHPPQRPAIRKTITNPLLIQPVTQPQGSKIILEQRVDYLDIILPPQGLGFIQILLISCAAPLAIIGRFSISTSISLSIFTWERTIAIAVMIILLLWSLQKRTRVRIDSQSICLYHEIFGCKWSAYPKIKLDKTNLQNLLKDFLIGKNEIYLDEKYYNLYDFHNFTILEKEWLTQEINKFLNKF